MLTLSRAFAFIFPVCFLSCVASADRRSRFRALFFLPAQTHVRTRPVPSRRRPPPPVDCPRYPLYLRYCLICAAAAQAFSVSFNASHLLPPLIDLMQDPVVNVRVKVSSAPTCHTTRHHHVTLQACAMARDICIIAQHGCVAEAGEESRLERVKAVLSWWVHEAARPCMYALSLTLSSPPHLQLHRGQRQGSQRLCARHVQGSRSVVTFLLLFFV